MSLRRPCAHARAGGVVVFAKGAWAGDGSEIRFHSERPSCHRLLYACHPERRDQLSRGCYPLMYRAAVEPPAGQPGAPPHRRRRGAAGGWLRWNTMRAHGAVAAGKCWRWADGGGGGGEKQSNSAPTSPAPAHTHCSFPPCKPTNRPAFNAPMKAGRWTCRALRGGGGKARPPCHGTCVGGEVGGAAGGRS